MSRRSRKKKGNQNISNWILISIVLISLVALMYFYFKVSSEQVAIDSKSNCRIDGNAPRDTIILLDATQKLSDSHLEALRNIINQYIDASILYERFTIYILGDDPDKYRPQFSVCNPGDGEGVSSVTGNPQKILRNWNNSFKQPIIDVVNSLDADISASSSPVMEMLKFVGLRSIDRNMSSEKRILIVSDMVENTESYSQYSQKNLSYREWIRTPYFRKTRSRLDNVEVNIIYVERPELSSIQGKDHIEKFWSPLIKEAGGRLQTVKTIN